jgi:rubredoxin
MKISFTCPVCGESQDVVEEVMTDVVMYSDIVVIDESGACDYGKHSTDAGGVEYYQCKGCGEILQDDDGNVITENFELVQWLKEHGNG